MGDPPTRFIVVLAAQVFFVGQADPGFSDSHLPCFLLSAGMISGRKVPGCFVHHHLRPKKPLGSSGNTSVRLQGPWNQHQNCGCWRRKDYQQWIFWRIKGLRRSSVSWEVWRRCCIFWWKRGATNGKEEMLGNGQLKNSCEFRVMSDE